MRNDPLNMEKQMEPEKLGIKESVEILDAVEVVGVGTAKILQDGTVNAADIPAALELLGKTDVVIKGIDGASDAVKEWKELDQAELIQLGTKTYEMIKNIHAASKAK